MASSPTIRNTVSRIINRKHTQFFLVGTYWSGAEQSSRFYKEGLWENGYENGAYSDIVKSAKEGDFLLHKSAYPTRKGESILRIKGIGKVKSNPGDGRRLYVDWLARDLRINVVGLGFYRATITKPDGEDVRTILSHILEDDYALRSIMDEDVISTTYEHFESATWPEVMSESSEGYNSMLFEEAPSRTEDRFFALAGAQPKRLAHEVSVFYATNRNRTSGKKANDFYGSELSKLTVGECVVSIPDSHRQGEMERPKSYFFFTSREVEGQHVMLKEVKPKSGSDFYSWLRESLDRSDGKSALLFVHGFNTVFEEAAWRTAQIAYDLPFNGIAGFFSWPSTAASLIPLRDYNSDMDKADASVTVLADFIGRFLKETGVSNLHIIAHSMGNRVAMRALTVLRANPEFAEEVKAIRHIVLAAPDIDRDTFDNEIRPQLNYVGESRTLYASDKDVALKLSKTLRKGRIRIGEAGDQIYVAEGLDTVDASLVMSEGNHHSYMFETKELLTDMYLLFTQNLKPSQRRLREVKKEALAYWLFPE